jgi:DNA polymerase III delta' subunit
MTSGLNLGDQVASRILASALRSGRIAHAYLLRGPAEAPKGDIAYVFAAGLLCDSPTPNGLACGQCYSCREVIKRAHPDLYMIPREGTAIRIKRSHEILKEAMSRPFHSKRKVFVLEDAEEMTIEASNALLKLVEEPPSFVVFILTTSNAAAMPETIISRCQVIPFRQVPKRDEGPETLQERIREAEDLLLEVLDSSPVERALRCAKTDPTERLSLVSALKTAIYGRIDRRIESEPDRDWSVDDDILGDYEALNALVRAMDRLQRNVNAFLTFSILFMELNRAYRSVDKEGSITCL